LSQKITKSWNCFLSQYLNNNYLFVFVWLCDCQFFAANFALPQAEVEGEEIPLFKEVIFTELDREEAAKVVEEYNKVPKNGSNVLTNRLLLNPIFLDCQSNPNPSQVYDWQSKSNLQNGLTIQSKSNHNPTIFGKRYRTANNEWSSFMMKPWNSQETFLNKFQPYCKIICLKILMKSSLASLLEHDALWKFNLLIK